jgi:hypothetical protein
VTLATRPYQETQWPPEATPPPWTSPSFNAPAALLSAAALIAVFRFNLGLTAVLGGAALGGILFVFAGMV